VKRLIQSDITKTLIFFTLTVVIAAVVSPWLYNVGKFIAEVGETRNLNVLMNWLAQKCDHAEFPRYFNRALLLCALVLAGPFIMWMRLGKEARQPRRNPWRIKLPKHSIAHDYGQALVHNRRGFLHLVTGFLLAACLLTLMVWFLLAIGWFSLEHPVKWFVAIRESLLSAAFVSVFEEWIFRGMMLGIFLRAMRPFAAIAVVSIFYASIHFLLPPDGVKLLNPGEADAGFRMISLVFQRFMSPQEFLLSFITLLVVGLILGYARYRTASLWLPIGLHAGWVFVHRVFQHIAELSGDHLASAEVLIGADRKSGLLPLSLLIPTGLLVHVFLQISSDRNKLES
jgi:membrane protease YdiL (CAAX protease family)|tara:strand:- start:11671 stop:12693 length:1023 start_codon:yes stop_codon:yes gene_type:complete